jgi:hypothetical protein
MTAGGWKEAVIDKLECSERTFNNRKALAFQQGRVEAREKQWYRVPGALRVDATTGEEQWRQKAA